MDYISLDYSLEHVVRLHTTLTKFNSILVGGVSEGRMNIIKIVATLG